MRLWEIAGALLVLAGLYIFYQIYILVVHDARPIEGGALTLMGIIVFRGGIHLLKVAAAVHACREYRAELRATKAPADGAKRRDTKYQPASGAAS